MYTEYFMQVIVRDNYSGELTPAAHLELDVFRECLWIGNSELLCKFGDKYYLQNNGLAMGVADSPDLANLYGYWFERVSGIADHPDNLFFGRYIDDCLGICYASSEQEAINFYKSKIQYDGCTIEWSASASNQAFLDMMLYVDYDNTVQHMPYRKAGNHQERIPWISHHPLDVKRGTFIGEMSRMATLSSKQSHYFDACTALVALYVKRGYPEKLVVQWLSNNIKERWGKRLNTETRESPDVLVLKTEYNSAWNYFNATELGKTILEYWREWLDRAERGDWNNNFYPPTVTEYEGRRQVSNQSFGQLTNVDDDLTMSFVTAEGTRFVHPDIRKTNILNRRMITSRKRTRNLFDLTSLWKKMVIQGIDESHGEEIHQTQAERFAAYFVPPIAGVKRTLPSDERVIMDVDGSSDEEPGPSNSKRQRRSSPPAPGAWRAALW